MPRSSNPEQYEAAVIERFLATGEAAAAIAQEFNISEATVQELIDRAAEAALGAGGRSSQAPIDAQRHHLTPPPGWYEVPPLIADPEPAAEADGCAEAEASAVETGLIGEMPVGGEADAADSAPGEFLGVDDATPPAWLRELAVRSLANGDSIAGLARWFNVPESQLQGWISDSGDPMAGLPTEWMADTDPEPGSSVASLASDAVGTVDDEAVAAEVEPPIEATAEIEAEVKAEADEELDAQVDAALDAEAEPEVTAGEGEARLALDARAAVVEDSAAVPPAAPANPLPDADVASEVDAARSGLTGQDDATSPDEAAALPVDAQPVEKLPLRGQETLSTSDGQQNETTAATRPSPHSARYTAAVYSSNRAVATKGGGSHHSLMSFRDSLQVLRRRLLIVVVLFILGASAGWVTAPGETRHKTSFRATHTLIYEPQGRSYNIEQVALLATSGEVPSRVAARLKLDRSQVRSAVSAEAKADVATISITGTSSEPDKAVALADVTAEELESEIGGPDRTSFDAEVGRLTTQVESARTRFTAIPPKDTARRSPAEADVQAAERALQQYQSSNAPKPQLRTLEKASATAVSPQGVRAPNAKPVRAALLGALGLLVGVVGTFTLDRLDSRLRSKGSTEEAFGALVVAEVPPISKSSQDQLLARTQPSSPFVESYRGLRTYVALWAPEDGVDDGHRVIVVTSPSAGEGKTTTVAHLAAMLAEIGRSVVVVSADLRRPRLHQYFDLPAAPGLVDALAGKPGPADFCGLVRPTPVRGVRLVPSGAPVENPAPLFEHAGDLLHALRPLADFVLVDAPPLLVANDAVEMARYADGVLLVARAGKTPVEAAQSSAEMLERLEIPVVGAVLVASESASSASRYYASRYYTEPERTGWRRRRPAGDNGRGPAAAVSAATKDVPSPAQEAPPAPEEAPPAVSGP
jgi:capsular exopolysaccharide synthesis family protein